MNPAIRVDPSTAERGRSYDLVIVGVGYEARCRYVADKLRPTSPRRLGLAFTRDRVLDFERNKHVLSKLNFEIKDAEDDQVLKHVSEAIAEISHSGAVRIAVDISSFTRQRIAIIFEAIRQAPAQINADITAEWYYSIARFSNPPETFVPNVIAGPVLPSFAGWITEPERPLIAVVGLGYEQDKALGAVEHVQASETWALKPISVDQRYDVALSRANTRFFEILRPIRVIEYRIEQAIECLNTLESLVYGILKGGNVLILPFGPKILTLCSLVVAHLHPEVAVWRVSAAGGETPVNRRASGSIAVLSTRFIHDPDLRPIDTIR